MNQIKTVSFAATKALFIIVFILTIKFGLSRGLVFGNDVSSLGYEVVPERTPLPVAKSEYGAMKATAAIEVLNGEAVVFLVGEKTHHPPATVRNRGLTQHHGHSA